VCIINGVTLRTALRTTAAGLGTAGVCSRERAAWTSVPAKVATDLMGGLAGGWRGMIPAWGTGIPCWTTCPSR